MPENKVIFVYGFKHIKTDKTDIYILLGSESDELNENKKLFNFWSNKFIIKEIEKRDFKILGWPFMVLVKRNKLFEIMSVSYQTQSTYSTVRLVFSMT